MYNTKILNSRAVRKQELPKNQTEQNFAYGTGSLRTEVNKRLFAKGDSLVDKILSCPPIKPSNSQTLLWDGVETGVLLSVFAQQFYRKNADVPDIHLTLLDAAVISPTLQTKMPQPKREEAGSFSENERQNLQKLHT